MQKKEKKRIWALDVYKACPVNQKKKRKEKREGTSKGKKNKKGKKKIKRQRPNQEKKGKRQHIDQRKKRSMDWTSRCELAHGHFHHLLIKFLSILERKHFVRPEEKISGPRGVNVGPNLRTRHGFFRVRVGP